MPAQSPEIGRAVGYSGDADSGVKALRLLGLRAPPLPAGLVRLVDRGFPVTVSRSKKSGSDRLERLEPSATSGGLEAGETNGEVCIASGILSLVSKTKNASPPSPSFMA